MADILIKGMEMPKTCFDCPFLRDDFCVVLGCEMRNDQILMGCGSCPLVEVELQGYDNYWESEIWTEVKHGLAD